MSHFSPPHFSWKQKIRIATCWLPVLLLCLSAQQALAIRYYVAPTASGNGSGNSWANAAPANTLQATLRNAVAGDEIWIKAGSYAPASYVSNFASATQLTNSFLLNNGVKVYGGFAGTENAVTDRSADINANTVILRAGGIDNYGWSVVYCSGANNSTLLDRVQIANGSSSVSEIPGGGVRGGYGGGMTISGGSPAIKDVRFNNNQASTRGGAVYISGNATPTFNNVVFTSNTCLYGFGGAVGIDNTSTPVFIGGGFYSNSAPYSIGGGGAIMLDNCSNSPSFTNVVFDNNSTPNLGGAIYALNANYTVNNCVFNNNASTNSGGAIYNKDGLNGGRTPVIYSSLFSKNGSYGSDGTAGAISNDRTPVTITNCTFYFNRKDGTTAGAGGIFSTSSSGTAITTITNCLFYGNYRLSGGNNVGSDVGTGTGLIAINYSSFMEVSNFGGTSGNTGTVSTPFVNESVPIGADGIWMTADDGLQLSFCNAAALIDKGNNISISLTTDLAGRPRKTDAPLVTDGGLGVAPIVDMGAYENQNTATAASIAGSIGNAHAVPNPQELFSDAVTSTTAPPAGATIRWQKTENNGTTWVAAPAVSPLDSVGYRLPGLTTTTSYRRVVTSAAYCNVPYNSNEVQIKVIDPTSDRLGVITGRVTSNGGAGVEGIIVKAIRQAALPGSPANYTYADTTDNEGNYRIARVFYGDVDDANAASSFTIRPERTNHSFDPASASRTVRQSDRNVTANFKDTTVISIAGQTYQQCTTCTSLTGAPETQKCPIDSVLIYKGGAYSTRSGYIAGTYGLYNITVTEPTTVQIRPEFANHTFSPSSTPVTPTNNISGIDFNDVTTRTISGKITDGCGQEIGSATLEFFDVLPNGPNGEVRSSCFRKRVTTNSAGIYSVNLPARKYRVRMVSYTTGGLVSVGGDTVLNFINALPVDSLIRDITTSDATLNLMYNRLPVISIASGLNIICTTPSAFALIRQATTDSFMVTVTQGPASLGCPLADTSTIGVITNVQQESATETIQYANTATGVKVKLKGGTPNITGDKLKNLFIDFTDKYGRTATQLQRKVLVTGVKADAATYTTVSPEIPLVVLHDPPGDASKSTWQQSNAISNAFRFYSAEEVGAERWAEVKIGTSLITGLGVSTESSVWGSINGSIGVKSTNTSTSETILTTTTSQTFSTADNPLVTGSNGDVYIGAALNLIYSVATEIGFTGCGNITSTRKLLIANQGFSTQYIYSEDFINNTLIPNLQSLAQLRPDSAARYLNQVSVWQQVVANNAENKRRAAFVQNYSFDGSAGPYTNTTTTNATKSNSIQYSMEINASVAAELGFEVAGSGASGGMNVKFRTESGATRSNTTVQETTIGYTLDDNTPGDFFSVNVKKDPVYNTPVFELTAGTASCPPEPNAQPRDAVFFTANNPVATGVAPTVPATFNLKIVNTSASTSTNPNDRRVYKLNYVQSSNVANETITIAGTPYNSNSPYITRALGYLDSVIVPVSITRQNGSSVYSYEGEQFSISSNCGDNLNTTVAVSAYFTSPCSNITMDQPTDGWQITNSSNNQIFIKPSGYTLANLSGVNLQFSTGNSWNDVFPSLTTAQLASGFTYNTTSLPEGPISFRLRLDCNNGTVYSNRATGTIDRRAPRLFGRPDPTDDNYVNGDAIAFTYDEKLNADPAALQVTMRRLSNNALIPVTASIFENKIAIVPGTNLSSLTGDSIRLIVSGVRDVYGNVKTTPDTTRFTIGTSVAATGNTALTVSVANPSVYKNDTATIRVYFTLPTAAANDTRVNYTIGGTALYGIHYTASYTGADALYASFNGSAGSIKIPAGQRQATLILRPVIGDTSYSPDKTIIISAAEGGDYGLSAATSITGNLISEDGVTEYVFTGDGAWNQRTNWLNSKMPLTTLVSGKTITINPSGTCILNVAQTIRPGSTIRVKENRRFIIQGNLRQN